MSFRLEVHHGGVFTACPNRTYLGGKIDVVDVIDSDLLSLLDLQCLSQHLGSALPVALYFKVPGLDLDIGLVHMFGDADVLAMIASLPPTRIAEFYVMHIGGASGGWAGRAGQVLSNGVGRASSARRGRAPAAGAVRASSARRGRASNTRRRGRAPSTGVGIARDSSIGMGRARNSTGLGQATATGEGQGGSL